MSVVTSRTFLAVAGLVLSLYAVYVELKMEHKPQEEEFTALCDIEAIGASCSTVFGLPVGHLVSYLGIVPEGHALDVPNAVLGVLYYIWQLLLADSFPTLNKGITTAAFLSSVFLAYQLTFVIVELCVLCWSTHVINTILMYKIVIAPKRSKASPTKKKQ